MTIRKMMSRCYADAIENDVWRRRRIKSKLMRRGNIFKKCALPQT